VTQGYSEYLLQKSTHPKVAIARDSRIKSDEFSMEAALNLCANGIKVYYFKDITTTPELSFAVRHLSLDGGIVITASHNPPEYNGYKIYDNTGCQILTDDAMKVIENVKKVKIDLSKTMSLEDAINSGHFEYISEDVYFSYYSQIRDLMVNLPLSTEEGDRIAIVYTPLHGTGGRPVLNMLSELGYRHVYPVEEQMIEDGNFPTAKSPNPESESVFALAKELGDKVGADILLATDPDADRVGVLIHHNDKYVKIDGNQMGALLANYLLEHKKDLDNKILIDTIVTSHLTDKIAKKYGAKLEKTLTGFKYIGEKINNMKPQENYILGFEESYGYMSGYHVRDKDAVNASALICEMVLYYKQKGMDLIHVLNEIYSEFGFFTEHLHSIDLDGIEGLSKIKTIMEKFRNLNKDTFFNENIKSFQDYESLLSYENGASKAIELPKADVVKVVFDDESWFALRPSGTEPKLKIYLSAIGQTESSSIDRLNSLKNKVLSLVE
jgi:phosphoglucomutase